MNLGKPNEKFADLLKGAKRRCLNFPGSDQSEGPFWNEVGDVIEQQNGLPVELQRKVSHYLQPILSHRFLNNLA